LIGEDEVLELYHNDMSTCAQKVRFALAEKGAAWHSHHLDLRARDQQKPEYLRLNPNGVVPTLIHDGVVIIESTVINEYIDDAIPGPSLRPADAAGKASMRLWTKQLDEGLHADTGVVSTAIAFRYQKLDRGPEEVEALLNNMPSPTKRERARSTIFEGVQSMLFRESILRFEALLARMDKVLESHRWLAGDAFSLADIAYAPYITRLDHLQLAAMWADRRDLTAWYHNICGRAGYQEGLAKWFNPKYRTLMAEKGRQDWPFIQQILSEQSAAAA
jgi:glutathione S-transferase